MQTEAVVPKALEARLREVLRSDGDRLRRIEARLHTMPSRD